jgi:hypothetical protein
LIETQDSRDISRLDGVSDGDSQSEPKKELGEKGGFHSARSGLIQKPGSEETPEIRAPVFGFLASELIAALVVNR